MPQRRLWPQLAIVMLCVAILFPLLFVMIGAVSSSNANALMCLVAGGIAGVALSFLGLRLTRFEVQDDGLHYTPNAYIGMALRHDEDSDVEHILLYGAKFPLAAALLLPVSKSYPAEEKVGGN